MLLARSSRVAALAIVGAILGFLAENQVDAYCNYGGTCSSATPSGCEYATLCSLNDGTFNAYYDPWCGSAYCCSGYWWCKDQQPPDFDCWNCGNTQHDFCGVCM
jgi:hypothetical protein